MMKPIAAEKADSGAREALLRGLQMARGRHSLPK
jgi:hypothetical protein